MYSPTTPREVTVVDGVLLIIASPPARDQRPASAHVAPADGDASPVRARSPVAAYFRHGRQAARCSARYVRPPRVRRGCAPAAACTSAARYSNRAGGRTPMVLFRENTKMEWMVLATRKRTPVESIFRAGLRVRTERAASARRAATKLRRSPSDSCRVVIVL